MRKEISWDGGFDTVVLDLRTKTLYSYETQYADFHEMYGGKLYYSSRSGLSGKGYIEKVDGILELGGYSVNPPLKWGVEVKDGGVTCYAPISRHRGISDEEYPIVLSDGNRVVFTGRNNLLGNIVNFHDDDFLNVRKKIEVSHEYYDYFGNKFHNEYDLIITEGARQHGANALRFIDIDHSVRLSNPEHPTYEGYFSRDNLDEEGLFGRKLGITKASRPYAGDLWVHTHGSLEYIDKIWNENPRKIKGEIINGWHGDGEGLFWRRRGLNIDVFMEVETASIDGGQWSVVEVPLTEFEERFSVVEFYHLGMGKVREVLAGEVREKAQWEWKLREELRLQSVNFLEALDRSSEISISVDDAQAAGNCLPGIEEFLKQWGLPRELSLRKLLEHPDIQKMLENRDFRRTLAWKLKQNSDGN